MTKFRFRMRRIARAAIPVATLVAVSALVVACGSSKPPQTAPPTGTTPIQSTTTQSTQPAQAPTQTTPTQPTPVSTPECATADLRIWVARDKGGGAMGTQYYLIEFKNVSDHTCQMRGYPGVSAIADGHQVGNSGLRDGVIKVSTVTLQPGATAHSLLGIHNADAYPAQLCDKVTAASLKIYPPNETTPVYVAFQFSACSATGTHQLVVSPVEAGPGNPEQVSR